MRTATRVLMTLLASILLFAACSGGGGGGGVTPGQNNNTTTGGTEANPAVISVGNPESLSISGISLYHLSFTTGNAAGSYGIAITGAQTDLSWDLFTEPDYSAGFVTSCDKFFGSGNEICTATLAANTTYYLRVHSWDNATTNYTLTLTYLDPAAGCGSGTCVSFETGSIPSGIIASGDAPWVIDNTTAGSGTYSVHSGAITDNQTSCFEYAPSGNTEVVLFSYKADSEEWADTLKLYIDGILQSSQTYSGVKEWSRAIFGTSLGQHTYKWCYAKDASFSTGTDRVWVDDIEFR